MFENLNDSIEILKSKIQLNLSIINQNERNIITILNEPVSENRTKKLKEKFDSNRKLLAENNDAEVLYLGISEYLDKYCDQDEELSNELNYSRNERVSDFIELGRDDYFKLTADGVIEFNKQHPYYNDEGFLDDLLNYHSRNENYEICSVILKQKQIVSRN